MRVLIVGTVPYNPQSTSRAFEAYFTGWPREELAQIFSNAKTPIKGHCGSLYQITDERLLRCRWDKRLESGRVFSYDQLPERWEDGRLEVNGEAVRHLYRLGRKKIPLRYLLRKWLWAEKYWHTEQLDRWLEEFRPECVFLAFSDDFFILEIARYAAEKFAIPIVSCIGDDYYFNDRPSRSLLYHLYRRQYKALVDRVLSRPGSAIYISDKIRDKYNGAFGLDGQTVYLHSELPRRPFRSVDRESPKIAYFGNIRQGRCESLAAIGDSLKELSGNDVLDVWSNQESGPEAELLRVHPNIRFHGSAPYEEVARRMWESDVVVIVEGFRREHVNNTRYSLSTKAADCLACGAQILVYGSGECGVVEYMASTGAAVVCTRREDLTDSVRYLLEDETGQRCRYEKAKQVSERNHNLSVSLATVRDVMGKAVKDYARNT